jgi:hypothetical protein
MAKVSNANPVAGISGKLTKSDKVIFRVKDGVQQAYVVTKPYEGPPSEAQKNNRSRFKELTQQVKAIYADPQQLETWTQRFETHKASKAYVSAINRGRKTPTTLYGFIFSSLSKQ